MRRGASTESPSKAASGATLNVHAKQEKLVYNAAGQLDLATGYRDANASSTDVVATIDGDYSGDPVGRLKGITQTVKSAAGATLFTRNYSYSYNQKDQLVGWTDPDGSASFNYDDAGQLTNETRAGSAVNFSSSHAYDGAGNRTENGQSISTLNRLAQDDNWDYTYDDDGDLVQKSARDGSGLVVAYTWDYRHRLTDVAYTYGAYVDKSFHYVYDAFDRRIEIDADLYGQASNPPTVQRMIYDGDDVLMRFEGTGTTPTAKDLYLLGPAVDQVFADDHLDGTAIWPLVDHQGSPRDLINSAGDLLAHLSYDAFGNLNLQGVRVYGPANYAYTYTGREFDGDTGLLYYRSRYYDPSVSRFLSEDILGFSAGDPNLYRYTGNDPVNRVDPSGHFWGELLGGLVYSALTSFGSAVEHWVNGGSGVPPIFIGTSIALGTAASAQGTYSSADYATTAGIGPIDGGTITVNGAAIPVDMTMQSQIVVDVMIDASQESAAPKSSATWYNRMWAAAASKGEIKVSGTD